MSAIYEIGTAGWSVPAELTGEGSHLQRYSRELRCVEVNSSFYRRHRQSTWLRWGRETPPDFRFSIKAPRTITHDARLRNVDGLLEAFLEEIAPIEEKTGCLLLQLPPSLNFETAVAEDFFASLRRRYQRSVALEPRHASWFTEEVNDLLRAQGIARVAADPAAGSSAAAEPGGDDRLAYYRLHGSPRTYYSNYEEAFLVGLAGRIRERENAWVIFDNTAASRAYFNAIRLQEMLREGG